MSKFNVGQKVYLLNGKKGVVERILPNKNYLIRYDDYGLNTRFGENLIFESEGELIKYKNEDADKKLSKLEALKSYMSKYAVNKCINGAKSNYFIIFSNNRMASVIWDIKISKFSILAFDKNGNFDFDLFENVRSEFVNFNGTIICDTESEIIDVLEIIRTAIPFEDLQSGDVFKSYVESEKEWQLFMIADDADSDELRVVNLSVGTYWETDSLTNNIISKYVLKLGNVDWERISVQFSSLK